MKKAFLILLLLDSFLYSSEITNPMLMDEMVGEVGNNLSIYDQFSNRLVSVQYAKIYSKLVRENKKLQGVIEDKFFADGKFPKEDFIYDKAVPVYIANLRVYQESEKIRLNFTESEFEFDGIEGKQINFFLQNEEGKEVVDWKFPFTKEIEIFSLPENKVQLLLNTNVFTEDTLISFDNDLSILRFLSDDTVWPFVTNTIVSYKPTVLTGILKAVKYQNSPINFSKDKINVLVQNIIAKFSNKRPSIYNRYNKKKLQLLDLVLLDEVEILQAFYMSDMVISDALDEYLFCRSVDNVLVNTILFFLEKGISLDCYYDYYMNKKKHSVSSVILSEIYEGYLEKSAARDIILKIYNDYPENLFRPGAADLNFLEHYCSLNEVLFASDKPLIFFSDDKTLAFLAEKCYELGYINTYKDVLYSYAQNTDDTQLLYFLNRLDA